LAELIENGGLCLKWLKENMAASHKKTAADGWEQKRRRRLWDLGTGY
jgi:hypothetical protein